MLWLSGTASNAGAGVQILSQGVTADRDAGGARFWMRLDGAPDFGAVDELGRPVYSFQYEVDADWTERDPFPLLFPIPFEAVDVVVRGDELDARDLTLPVRAAGAGVEPDADPDADPDAGGWGPVVDRVLLRMDGADLWFDVPLESLGDDDGVFAYRLFTTEFGATVSLVESTTLPPPSVIPLPPAPWGALATAAAFSVMRRVRQRAARANG